MVEWARTLALGLILSLSLNAVSVPDIETRAPADVFITGTFPIGQKQAVSVHADTEGYPEGTYFRWEWLRGSGVVRVTREPFAMFLPYQAAWSELHVVQVAYLPDGTKQRDVSSNRIVVKGPSWVIFPGASSRNG